MRPGSVLVDISVDQGGIAETSRPTSHSHPIYVEEGVVHYCVPNMPAAVARTATLALTQATLPYVLELAILGCAQRWRAMRIARRPAGLCGTAHPSRPGRRRETAVDILRRISAQLRSA